MLQSSSLMTVADCENAIAAATEEKVMYEARKISLSKQIPNLEGALDVSELIANVQADLAAMDQLLSTAVDPDLILSVTKRRNNFENRLIDLQNKPEVSVMKIKTAKHLDLDSAEYGTSNCVAAITAYEARKAALAAAAIAA